MSNVERMFLSLANGATVGLATAGVITQSHPLVIGACVGIATAGVLFSLPALFQQPSKP